jgi:hypothetical protein
MDRSTRSHDAPFFGRLIVAAVLAASLGFFALAASTLLPSKDDAGILSVSAIYASKAPIRTRVGVMTERVRESDAARIARVER